MKEIKLHLEPSAHAPRMSRSGLIELQHDLEPKFSDVAIVVSELVTNSVKHGDGTGDISVEVETDVDRIVVTVSDQGPCFAKGDPRNGGMGLAIIDQIAQSWGVEHDNGCRVWVEISKAT